MNTFPIGGTINHKKSVFHVFDGRDLLVWLKDVALEAANMKSYSHKLHNQMLKVRKLMNISDEKSFQKKRKYDQYMDDGKSRCSFELNREKKYNNQVAKNHRRESIQETLNPSPMKKGILMGHYETFENKSNYMIKTSIKEKTNTKLFKESKSSVKEDFDDSSRSLYSLSSKKKDMQHDRPLSFWGNHYLRPVIPIGPRFQAEIPQSEDKSTTRPYIIDDDFKWISREIRPMPNIMETKTRGVGNNVFRACSCDFPKSIDCIKLHIDEASELLQLETGTSFSSWNFDEMEDVSKSWTLEEQKEFDSLTRLKSLSNDMDFWKVAMEKFKFKPLKSMINYYYNVCIPRQMSMKTRASFGMVDSDDNKPMDYKKENDDSAIGKCTVPIYNFRKSRIKTFMKK